MRGKVSNDVPKKTTEYTYVLCPIWNITPEQENIRINRIYWKQNLLNKSDTKFGKRKCDSYILAQIPIFYEDYGIEKETKFIEQANKLSDEYVTSFLTRLRLFTLKNILNTEWFGFN